MKFFEVLVINREAKRLDKFAVETLGALKVSEKKKPFSRKRRVVYRFDNDDGAIEFIFGVRRNFGLDAFIERMIN